MQALAICALCFAGLSGCATGIASHSRARVTLRADSTKARARLGNLQSDTIENGDDPVDTYGILSDSTPECSEIEFLLENAQSACKADSFAEAHCLLQKALEAIKAKRENEKGWAEAESCSNLAAALYSDDMPPEYMDSVPDDISMLVFQKQLSHSLDTLKLTASDSVSLGSWPVEN